MLNDIRITNKLIIAVRILSNELCLDLLTTVELFKDGFDVFNAVREIESIPLLLESAVPYSLENGEAL